MDTHGLGTRYRQRKQLFRNLGTSGFRMSPTKSAAALLLEKSSRGAAFGDYDNDGDIDVLVVNMDDRPTLLRNDTHGGGHWITLAARRHEEQPRRDRREGHASTAGGRTQIGGGAQRRQLSVAQRSRARTSAWARATRARVQIRWPSGLVEPAADVQADGLYVAREGQGIPLSGPRSASAGAPPSRGR